MAGVKFKRTKLLDLSEQPASIAGDFQRGALNSRRDIVGPVFIKRNFEQVIQQGQSYIVLGKDRTGTTGYNLFSEDCASIDLVVGRRGAPYTESGERNHVHPNFLRDASRIYISQKTDLDDALGLVPGAVGTVRAKAGIALVSDEIRIASRGGVKIATSFYNRDSRGEPAKLFLKGLDIVAGNNDTDLQPMVKGDSLMRCLEYLIDEVNSLNGVVNTILIRQSKFNTALMTHTHLGNLGAPTSPSVDLIAPAVKKSVETVQSIADSTLQKVNMINFKLNFLNPMSRNYVCSRHHRLN